VSMLRAQGSPCLPSWHTHPAWPLIGSHPWTVGHLTTLLWSILGQEIEPILPTIQLSSPLPFTLECSDPEAEAVLFCSLCVGLTHRTCLIKHLLNESTR
jgi:hypothetical protein